MESHANTAHIPSFSLIWFEPVPNDSSPQITGLRFSPLNIICNYKIITKKKTGLKSKNIALLLNP
jgi:hypothetical protein